MPKLGQIVYYRTESAVYPAAVTALQDGGSVALTVFTLTGQLFQEGVLAGTDRYQYELAPPGEGEDARIVIVQMPATTARDRLAVTAEAVGSAQEIADAEMAIAIWPNGDHLILKDRTLTGVTVVQGMNSPPQPDPSRTLMGSLALELARRVEGEDREAENLLDRYVVEAGGPDKVGETIKQAIVKASGSC